MSNATIVASEVDMVAHCVATAKLFLSFLAGITISHPGAGLA